MEKRFLEAIAEALEKEVAEISISDAFRDYPEWDSIAVLSVMATLEEAFGLVLSRNDLEKCTTLKDLFALIPS